MTRYYDRCARIATKIISPSNCEKYTRPHMEAPAAWYKVIRNAPAPTRSVIRGFRANTRPLWVRHYQISDSTRPNNLFARVWTAIYKYLTWRSHDFVPNLSPYNFRRALKSASRARPIYFSNIYSPRVFSCMWSEVPYFTNNYLFQSSRSVTLHYAHAFISVRKTSYTTCLTLGELYRIIEIIDFFDNSHRFIKIFAECRIIDFLSSIYLPSYPLSFLDRYRSRVHINRPPNRLLNQCIM